ncbi:urea transporter 1-like isoform X1 [Brachyistius frenatus]|uniref:urea transporter 1-like isoform X1 n=1 Tax=Brachyistius frenatus TaxID=100188 RepID=UPI0037E728DE
MICRREVTVILKLNKNVIEYSIWFSLSFKSEESCWISLLGQAVVIQLLDCIFRGVAQVMFVNNPLSGLLVVAGLFVQNPWWALNGLLGTFVSTGSAILLGQSREAISMGLHGYNGTLVGILMAVFSAKGSWYWWLLLPNVFTSMLCPVVSSALSSLASKWDLPVFTLPFNILVCLHIAATGAAHPYFPEVDIQPKSNLHPSNDSIQSLSISQLFLSVPVGVGQVYGCDSPWTGGLILLALLLCSPTICFHAMLGSAAGIFTGFALAAPHRDIYSGLWGYNSALSCIAIGGVFYVLTWQTHLLAIICALFSAYMTSATSKLMSVQKDFNLREKKAAKMSAYESALSGSVSVFIFTFMNLSLCVYIAICLSVCVSSAHGCSLATTTHWSKSHSQTCVGVAERRRRRCETREGDNLKNENISFLCLVIKYDLL